VLLTAILGMAQSGLQVGLAQICDKVGADERPANGWGPAKWWIYEIWPLRGFGRPNGLFRNLSLLLFTGLGRVIKTGFTIWPQ